MKRRAERVTGQAFLAATCLFATFATALLGRDDDPREITSFHPDGTQETYILMGLNSTNHEGYNFPTDVMISKSSYD